MHILVADNEVCRVLNSQMLTTLQGSDTSGKVSKHA